MTKKQKLLYALITVIITVHAYVFYSLYVINGSVLMSVTGESSVLNAINFQGGIMMLGKMVPIWLVVIVEFILAYSLEVLFASNLSFKIASKTFDIKKTNPIVFETTVICSTILIMCPAMSFLASILYYPYYMGFNIFTLLANFLKLICLNFPFALFTQIFFIQPLVRKIFKIIYKK